MPGFCDDFDDIIAGAAIPKPAPKLKSVPVSKEDAPPRSEALSEDDVADHFIQECGQDWRWVPEWDVWMHYDDKTGWQRERSGLIYSDMKEYCRKVLTWGACEKTTVKDRRAICGVRFHNAVIAMMKTDRRIVSDREDWDADDWMIGTPIGPFNLKTLTQLRHNRNILITRSCAVAPDFKAESPLWSGFLESMTVGNKNLWNYLHRLSGLSLTGDTSDEAFTFMYGLGQNGKGTFLSTIMSVLGLDSKNGYAAICNYTTFFENKHGEGHAEEIARLDGMRLVGVTETPENVPLNEARIKALTGGDMVTARGMGQNTFQYKPKLKLIVVGNFPPVVKGVGPAMARRLHLFPCLAIVPPSERNYALKELLKHERPAIMAWMIRGLEEWKIAHLSPPQEVTQATSEFLESEDVTAEWISDRCVQEGRAIRADAYRDFKLWCKDQGKDFPMSDRSFYEKLRVKGINRTASNGVRYLQGITLKPREEKPREWFADRD